MADSYNNSEMDVAFVNRTVGMRRGGGELYDLEMARALTSLGVDVTFYTGEPISGGLSKPVEVSTQTVKSPFLYDLAYAAPMGIGGVISDIDRQAFIKMLSREMRETHDIVYLNGYPEFLQLKEYVDCPVTIKLNGMPHSLFYDYIHPTKSSYTWLKLADAIFGNTRTINQIEGVAGIRGTVINPGVDIERFSPRVGMKSEDPPVVLWVGRLVPVKNLEELLSSFELLLDGFPDAELWIVGEGPESDKIESQAVQKGIRNSTKFVGHVPNNEIAQYYLMADVFALSSRSESFGMVLLESMACGTPVVAPNIDHIPEIIDHGYGGLLYESGDVADLSEKLSRVLLDRGGSSTMRKYARQSVVNGYSWNSRAEKLFSCFKRVYREHV